MAIRSASVAATFAVTFILISSLTPTDYGAYIYNLAIVEIICVIFGLRLSDIITTIARKHRVIDFYKYYFLQISLFVISVGASALLFLLNFVSNISQLHFVMMAATASAPILRELYRSKLMLSDRFLSQTLFSAFTPINKLVILGLVWSVGKLSIEFYIIGLCLSELVFSVLCLFFTRPKFFDGVKHSSMSISEMYYFRTLVISLYLSGGLEGFTSRFDKVAVALGLGIDALPTYDLLRKSVNTFRHFITPIMSLKYNRLSLAFAENKFDVVRLKHTLILVALFSTYSLVCVVFLVWFSVKGFDMRFIDFPTTLMAVGTMIPTLYGWWLKPFSAMMKPKLFTFTSLIQLLIVLAFFTLLKWQFIEFNIFCIAFFLSHLFIWVFWFSVIGRYNREFNGKEK